jgi:hypothetical protein
MFGRLASSRTSVAHGSSSPERIGGQRDRGVQLVRVNQEVKGEVEFAQQADPLYHLIRRQEIVRLGLGDVAHPAEAIVAGEVLETRGQVGHAKVNPSYHAQDERMLLGQIQQEAGFVLGLIGLHGDATVHPVSFQLRPQVARQEILPDPPHLVGDPGVANRVVLPEVLVRVDSHGASVLATARWRDVPSPSIPSSTTSSSFR